ncbi:dihydroorotase [Vannielia litorea]|uniref:Dihydroorotase n=1 Tax=Vannielia litorea TaxID=1217970 RepID=A0A1N6HDE7_9RHOB|nr:dihydroorotase [Vannielia litorea]SIO17689.1 dihydroorotase [Vannielia litorea]
MTTTLFTNVTLIDPEALTEGPGHLLVTDGRIADVAQGPMATPEGTLVVDGGGKVLAPGIVDLGVKICEPGERHKESFKSAGAAAAAGGVTTIIMRPDTLPAIDSPETLEFVTRRAGEAPVTIRAMATLTKNREGREMAELSFLKDAGALAFSDGDKVVADTKVLARALSYARELDALVVGHPQEPTLSKGAAATSGKLATLMGLPAVSPMAERMGVDRDIAMVEMTGARYHFDQLSAARALPPLERAKGNGFDITAGVSIHHLTLNVNDLSEYRTFFKLKPPLRDEEDRLAMVEAVGSGLIDVISSMHTPQDEESKRLPFEEAASGAVALETLLPAAMRLLHAGLLSLPQLFRALALNPARRLGLPAGRLARGAPADLVLFDPHAPFLLDRATLRSKSKNTPFDGARMEGKVLGTWVGGRRVFG